MASDCNDRERELESLRELNRQLEEQIERAHEMALKAEFASVAKSQFLANMSHEIRTPLNGIIGFTELLMETGLTDAQREYVATIRDSGTALLRIIEDILDFSKIEAGHLDLETIAFSPGDIVAQVCAIVRPRIAQKNVDLVSHVAENTPAHVLGDPHRTRQVLLNLVGNAAKFTEQGRIEVTVACDDAADDRMLLHFTVADTGIGVSKKTLKEIFEPFRQADSSTTRKYGGTGLGLAISRKISNLMQGDVWAESELGKGSVFHFTGKFKKALFAAQPSEQPAAAVSAGDALLHAHILLADDNPVNRKLAMTMLQKMGCAIECAVNGREAVEKFIAAPDRYDLVLMDLHMPEMDGFSACEKIRATGSKIPIIAMTADVLHDDRAACLNSGMNDCLTKPYTREKLHEVIGHWVGSKQAQNQ